MTWFAIARLGAVMAPVNSSLCGRPLRDALVLVQSEVVVVHESLWAQFAEIRPELASLREVIVVGHAVPGTHAWSDLRACAADGSPPQTVHFSELCLLLYTSGSTGSPKGVMISHANALHNVTAFHGLKSHDTKVISREIAGVKTASPS